MMLFAVASVLLLLTGTASSCLEILSFNVKKFGMTKLSDQDTVNILIKIVEQYDISLIMEVVDVTETLIPNFIMQINSAQTSGTVYNYSISERLGSSSYKEQYAFIYRTQTVHLLDTYQYPDSNGDFERPPFCILVRSTNPDTGDLPEFFLVGSHTKPDAAVTEINYLDNVLVEAMNAFGTHNGMVLGDLNADCAYVSQTKFMSLDLVMDTSVTWWIDSDTDTTTGNSYCSYDRIITTSNLTPHVVNGSAGVVRFDLQYNLTQEQVNDVSDHYPVEIALQGLLSPSPSPTPDNNAVNGSYRSDAKLCSLLFFLTLLVLFV